jgi:PAS domain S-box-containing protein
MGSFLLEEELRRLEKENEALRKQLNGFGSVCAPESDGNQVSINIENIPEVAIISRLRDGQIFEINDLFVTKTGYTRNEVIGKTVFALNFKHSKYSLYKLNQTITQNRKISHFPVSFDNKFGGSLSGLYSAFLFEREGDKYLFGFVIDITELKDVENSLKEIERTYFNLFNNLPTGIYRCSFEGGFFEVNLAMVKMLGYDSVEELKSINAKNLFVNPADRNIMHDLTANCKHGSHDVLLKKKNGEQFWAFDYFTANYGPDGKIVSYDGSIRDINERMLSRQAIAQEKDKFEKFASFLKSAIFTVNEDGFFAYVNPAMTTITGYSCEELLKTKFWEVVHPDFEELVKSKGTSRLHGEYAEPNYEIKIITKNGGVKWLELNNSRIELMGAPFILGTAMDITDKRYNEQLQQVIYNITAAVISEKKRKEVYLIAKSELGKLIDTSNFFIVFYDEENQSLNLPFIVDDNDRFKSFPSGKTLTSYVIHKGKPMLFTENEMDTLSEKGEIEMVGTPSKAWMGAPMNVNGTTIGLLAVQNYRNENAFSEKDLKVLAFASNQLAVLFARKDTEDKLMQSEEKFRLLAENNPGVIYLCLNDHDYTMLYLNDQIEEITGLKKESLLKKEYSFSSLIHPDDVQNVRISINNGLLHERPFEINYRIRHIAKGYIWVREIGAGVFRDNKLVYLQGVINDVHEQNQAKQALEESEERNRALSQTANEAIVFTDRGYIIEANTAAQDVFGYSYEEMLGEFTTFIFAPESLAIAKQHVLSGYELPYEAVGMRKNGQVFPMEVHAKMYVYKGREIRVAVCRNISKNKEYEELILEKNEKLEIAIKKAEESDRLKSAFLANMSHEIRTPLNGILGFAELLKYTEEENEKEGYISVINNSGNQLLNIINDIIDISKIEAGQLHILPVKTDLNLLFNNLKIFYDDIIEKKESGIKFILNIPEETVLVMTDKKRVQQVLSNFIDNAIKFTKKGEIEVSYAIVQSKAIQFCVSDTGIGINEDEQKIVFERFRQVDDSFTREFGGTGLGLAICKHIVKLLGGEIWVESMKNVGSSFFFEIPLVNIIENEDLKTEKSIDLDRKDWRNKKVLIVEDDESNFMYLETAVRSTGIRVFHAKNGLDAVRMFKEEPGFDVILMDIQLPVMNGLDATREIKKINPGVPIIAQTAFAMSEDEHKCKEAGCDDYVSKPLKRQILIDKLKIFIK